jgi:uncharacterized membrane protein YesL
MRFEIFLERFFNNFPKILVTNLLFAIPSAVIFGVFYALNMLLFKGLNIGFSILTIIPLYPFYAGVVMIARNIARGDKEIAVVPTFIAAVKENFLHFLLHGVVVCAATEISYFSLSFYISLLSVSWFMYVVLFFCFLITLLALYICFYLPLMSITYDIPLRYLYKNCFLMSFGEFKNNLFATLAIAVVLAICFTVTAFLPSVPVLVSVLALLWALLVPATFTYSYVFFIYDGMVNIIESKSSDIPAGNKEVKAADKPVYHMEEDDFSDIDISQLKDTDDYIYHNGRMVKQSALLKMIREREAGGEAQDE